MILKLVSCIETTMAADKQRDTDAKAQPAPAQGFDEPLAVGPNFP